jgi:hypothetical protein
MTDDRLFLVVKGVGPADFPVHETDPNKRDEAVALADDIFELLQEDYDKDVAGVVPVVNPDAHEQLQKTER